MQEKIRNDLNGWLIIDKPKGMGSTQVVGALKRFLHPMKIGHAGTLDPLADGVLPIALGKATRLIPYVMDSEKIYEFDVTWGCETTTDDLEGEIVQTSDLRPTKEQIEAVLPRFIGQISQMPPIYSALKINGERAYDLARLGKDVSLKERLITVKALEIKQHSAEKTRFCVTCGKGTYVRALGRDLGRILRCFGHVTHLRRLKCGPFHIEKSILLANFEKIEYKETVQRILPLETVLDDILVLAVKEDDIRRLIMGQALSLKSFISQYPKGLSDGMIFKVFHHTRLVALVQCVSGAIRPLRIFTTIL